MRTEQTIYDCTHVDLNFKTHIRQNTDPWCQLIINHENESEFTLSLFKPHRVQLEGLRDQLNQAIEALNNHAGNQLLTPPTPLDDDEIPF